MFLVELNGGLGNQMFQYSLGFYLSKKYNKQLVLDVSRYEFTKTRSYELEGFNISKRKLAIDKDFRRFESPEGKISNFFKLPVYEEKDVFYHEEVLRDFSKGCYLKGYFQSYLYFNEVRNDLLREFQLSTTTRDVLENIKEIEGNNGCIVHFRRGDYVSNQVAFDTHGLCSINYYNEAINYLKTLGRAKNIYVFSDDLEWVIGNDVCRGWGTVSYVDIEKKFSSVETLNIMSKGVDFITANSTFSWWAAWLSTKNGVIITPKRWFKNPIYESRDRIPNSWVRI